MTDNEKHTGVMDIEDPSDGGITFSVTVDDEPKEMVKISADGKFYVKGRLVETDREVYDGFRRFLIEAGAISGDSL